MRSGRNIDIRRIMVNPTEFVVEGLFSVRSAVENYSVGLIRGSVSMPAALV